MVFQAALAQAAKPSLLERFGAPLSFVRLELGGGFKHIYIYIYIYIYIFSHLFCKYLSKLEMIQFWLIGLKSPPSDQ